jgi:hypothetical protein
VELRDDHALGAVHDELAAPDHDRDLAEVDLLLDRRLLLDAHADLEGAAVGEPQLAALVGRVARRAELVAEVLELHRPVVGRDREHLAQDPLEAEVLAVLLRDGLLEELRVRARLQVDEVRDVEFAPRAVAPHRPLVDGRARVAGLRRLAVALDVGGTVLAHRDLQQGIANATSDPSAPNEETRACGGGRGPGFERIDPVASDRAFVTIDGK